MIGRALVALPIFYVLNEESGVKNEISETIFNDIGDFLPG